MEVQEIASSNSSVFKFKLFPSLVNSYIFGLKNVTMATVPLQSLVNSIVCFTLMMYAWIKVIVTYVLPSKEKSVTGKTILITGGASGIGRLMSLDLARRGGKIVIWDINQQQLDATSQDIREVQKCNNLPEKVWAYNVDVSNYQSVYDAAAKVTTDIGSSIDILINNAGVVSGAPLMSLKETAIIRSININTLAHFWTCKAFLQSMINKNDGHIVTIASMAGFNGARNLTDYCASKFGAVGFHESLSYELACKGLDGIKFTLVAPFLIDTGMFAGAALSVLAPIKPENAANAIVRGILTDEEFITLPSWLRVLGMLKFVLPYSAVRYLNDMLGGDEFMQKFTGREKCVDENANSLHDD